MYKNICIVLAALVFTGTATANSRDEAASILDKYIASAGGRAAVEKITTARVRTAVKERNQDLEVELQMQIPDKVLFQLTAPNGMSISMGFGSKGTAWRDEGGGAKTFDGEMAVGMYRTFLGLMPGAFLQLQTNGCLQSAVVDAKGGAAVIHLTPEPGSPMELQFDKTDGRLLAIDKHTYADYREVDGVKVPFSVKDENGFSFNIKEVHFNVALPSAEFNSSAWTQPATPPEEPYRTLASAAGKMEVVRKPAPMIFNRKPLTALPQYDPQKPDAFAVDLRGADCSPLKLGREELQSLLHSTFDSKTKWPELKSMPEGFDPETVLSLGINPGLKVRELHQRGITGRGVGIGIIDQTLLVDHVEYRDRLRLYEEIHNNAEPAFAMMHGPAVASIALGKTVGVAPGAELYYIAETHGTYSKEGRFEWDFTWVAKSIDRLLEINKTLPADKKLRVISISVGWSKGQDGYDEVNAAVKRAEAENVFVISTSLQETHCLYFHGLGRDPNKNPDLSGSYTAGSWWARRFFSGEQSIDAGKYLLVPMDSRTTASPTGPEDYVFYAGGGWSWSVPYIAGVYALTCQVDSTMTPKKFWDLAIKTGDTISVDRDGRKMKLGSILNPIALFEKLKK